MLDNSREALAKQLFAEIRDTYIKKNAAYGNSAHASFKKFGVISYAVRLHDKICRYIQLKNAPETDDIGESIDDTLKDGICYCVMAMGSIAAKEVEMPKLFTVSILKNFESDPALDVWEGNSFSDEGLLKACTSDTTWIDFEVIMGELLKRYLDRLVTTD